MALTGEISKTRQITQLLEKQIRDHDLSPGDRLPSARDLAEQFSVSTAVSMSVYKALEKKGLIVREARRGIFVKTLPPRTVSQLNVLAWNGIFSLNETQQFFTEPALQSPLPLKVLPFYTAQYGGYDKYIEWIADYCKTEAAPSLVAVDEGLLPVLAGRNLLLPLNDLFKNSPLLGPDAFPEKLLRCLSYQGKNYALPVSYSPTVMFYNRRIFERSGLPCPDDSWSWQQLYEQTVKLTQIDPDGAVARYGLGILFTTNTFASFAFQNGGELFDRHGSCCIASDESFTALSFFSQLYGLKGVCSHRWGDERSALVDLMAEDLLAMLIGDANDFKIIQKRMPSADWGMTRLPSSGRPATSLSIQGWAVAANGAGPASARNLLEKLFSGRNYDRFCEFAMGVPACRPEQHQVPELLIRQISGGEVGISTCSIHGHRAISSTLLPLFSHRMKLTREQCRDFQEKINRQL